MNAEKKSAFFSFFRILSAFEKVWHLKVGCVPPNNSTFSNQKLPPLECIEKLHSAGLIGIDGLLLPGNVLRGI